MVRAAFCTEVGVDNDPLDADGGYIWYNVAGVTPSRDRTLDEVKDRSRRAGATTRSPSRLKAKSAELLDKLKAGTPFDAIASADGLKVETADKLTRGKPRGRRVRLRSSTRCFSTAKDAFGSAEGDKPNEWVVFRVTDVTTPKLDANSPDAKRIADVVKRQESDDISEQYMALAGKRTRHHRQSGGARASPRQQRAGYQLNMQIEPSAAAFAARYAAGEPQVVWTTLVADLETPVSAFLKIAGAPADELSCSNRSKAARCAAAIRLSGSSPTSSFACNGADAEINRTPHNNPEAFAPAGAPPLQALRALIAESRIALPDNAAADGGRRLRLSRLRHGAADGGHVGRAAARSDRHPGRHLASADPGGRLRRSEGHDHRRDAGAAASRRAPPRPRLRARPSACRRSSMRSTGRSTNRRMDDRRRPARR